MSVYDFTVKAQDGSMIPMSDYKGKVLVIVNSATECGFTPQYDELQKLYDEHKKDGLEILDFPCNQFMNQAPGTDDEIHTFCTGRFGITFPQFSKVDVNGENAIPLYKYLTSNSSFGGFGRGIKAMMMNGAARMKDKDYKNNGSVKWNFTKFLIDREGNIAGRFEPTDSMSEFRNKVEELLQ